MSIYLQPIIEEFLPTEEFLTYTKAGVPLELYQVDFTPVSVDLKTLPTYPHPVDKGLCIKEVDLEKIRRSSYSVNWRPVTTVINSGSNSFDGVDSVDLLLFDEESLPADFHFLDKKYSTVFLGARNLLTGLTISVGVMSFKNAYSQVGKISISLPSCYSTLCKRVINQDLLYVNKIN